MKIGIYARVSTQMQNVSTQLVPLREFAARNGFEVFNEYVDEGVSGTKDSRPRLDSMLKDMREGEIEAVVIYKLDRLGRSLKHLIDLIGEFKNKKVRLISISDNLDTVNDNPMSRAFWQLLGVFAEFERELIRERVKAGLERAKSEGKTLGRKKGSKDKRKRSVSGYHLRYAGTSKEERKF
jgi:DNA invertase Pin-like site-specific DNA recombinase